MCRSLTVLALGLLTSHILAAEFEGQRVVKYTREYASDYGGMIIREEYHAYSREIQNVAGKPIRVDIWHGQWTKFHDETKQRH